MLTRSAAASTSRSRSGPQPACAQQENRKKPSARQHPVCMIPIREIEQEMINIAHHL